jgi:hypothetical protein
VPVNPWGDSRGREAVRAELEQAAVEEPAGDGDIRGTADAGRPPESAQAAAGTDATAPDAAAAAPPAAASADTPAAAAAAANEGSLDAGAVLDLAAPVAGASEHLPRLREISRREYVQKKAHEAVLLLEQELRDETDILKGQRPTEREVRELERKRELLVLARDRLRIADAEVEWGHRYVNIFFFDIFCCHSFISRANYFLFFFFFFLSSDTRPHRPARRGVPDPDRGGRSRCTGSRR